MAEQQIYDLRSDTITKPSAGMRQAMARAEVGDDVYLEDPTINRLQAMSAALTGKKAALFLPSGSMGNLIPIFLQCGRGKEVIAHKNSHIFHYELDSMAALAGAMPVSVEGERGIVTPEAVEKALRPDIYYMPKSGLIEIENTHNVEGGTCYSQDQLKRVFDFAKKTGLPVHMDGARVFNAAAATGISVKKIAAYTDTITFCLSKGLGAPVGSMLCGSKEFIAEARRLRKMLGGGMRQAGVLAAAGMYALENNVERIAQDHLAAKEIARALEDTDWAEINADDVETNIVFFSITGTTADKVTEALKKKGVLCSALGHNRVRMVTSLAVTKTDITRICSIIRALVP